MRRTERPSCSTASASSATPKGDELTAIIYLRLGLDLKGDHPLALVTLGDVYERLKQYDKANAIFERIPKDSPVRPSADISIGHNFELMGRGDDAIAHLETLMKQRPDDVEVVMALGNVQRSRKKFAEAAETYDKAINLHRPARARPLDPLLLPRHVL